MTAFVCLVALAALGFAIGRWVGVLELHWLIGRDAVNPVTTPGSNWEARRQMDHLIDTTATTSWRR